MADTPSSAADPGPERIDVRQDASLRTWARKLDATPEQIKEAVQAVGDRADRVEEHLKGSRATTNSERVSDALRKGPAGDGRPG
jgi:hypothetical protein